MWSSTAWRVLAASLTLVTPAGLYYSRVAPRSLLPVTFVLVWLWCVGAAEAERRKWPLLAGAFVLGVGCYSYTTAIVLMPVYLVMTVGLSVREQRARWLPVAIMAVFVLAASFGVWRVASDRSAYADRIQRYRIYDASKLNPLQGTKDFANYNNIQERVSLWWDYFDPSYLFLTGGAEMSLVRPAGVLPTACALWIPIGLYQLLKRRTALDLILLGGFITSPLAAILVDERYIARRHLAVIPFGILIGVFGAEHLLSSGNRFWRVVTIALWVSALVQGLLIVLQR